MKGFLVGTGLVIIVSQIPKILGLSGAPSSFFGKIRFILQNLPEINIFALALGIGALLLFFVLEHKFPRLPGTLLVVILSIIFVALTDLAERGVEIVGTIPQGLPELGMPLFSPGDVELVLPLAIGLFILSFVELSTIARTYAKEHEYRSTTTRNCWRLARVVSQLESPRGSRLREVFQRPRSMTGTTQKPNCPVLLLQGSPFSSYSS